MTHIHKHTQQQQQPGKCTYKGNKHCENDITCAKGQTCKDEKCISEKIDSRPCDGANQCPSPSLCSADSKTCMLPSNDGSDKEEENKETCNSIKDCNEKYVCTNSVCVYAGSGTKCEGTPDCAMYFRCVNKICHESKALMSCKDTTKQCRNMEKCEKDTCVPWPNENTCKKTSDCGVSQRCTSRKLCIDVPVGTKCSSTKKDCGLGEVCIRGKCKSSKTPSIPCPKRPTPLNAVQECTPKQCTYTCRNNLELNGHAVSKCLQNATWDHPPPQCALPFTCAPIIKHVDEESCLAEGYCSCRVPIDPDSLQQVPLSSNSTSEGCGLLVEESTGKPCVWKPANVWVPGKGKMALFYAIKRRDRVAVRSVCSFIFFHTYFLPFFLSLSLELTHINPHTNIGTGVRRGSKLKTRHRRLRTRSRIS